jgi:purine catabolism regulator
MTLSVGDMLDVPGLALRLVAGDANAARPIRWVHASELEDPTPWLKGGELLLTTGAGVGNTPARQRAYVQRLAKAGLAGLGFGLGFSYERIPRAVIAAAEQLGFPLFEVPYPVPFIAITEAVFTRLVAEQYDVLQRAVDAEQTLTRAAMDGEGPEGIAASLARATGGWALLVDLHGVPMVATSPAARQRVARIWEELRVSRRQGTGFGLSLADRGHHVSVQPVGAQGRVEAFLAVGKLEPPTQFDRIVTAHALSLFAIELAKSRAVAEAERRLRGDFFDALAAGSLQPGEMTRGLARYGFAPDDDLVVLAVECGSSGSDTAADRDRRAGADAASRDGGTHPDQRVRANLRAGANRRLGGEEDLTYAADDELSRSGAAYLISRHDAGVHALIAEGSAEDLAEDLDGLRTRVEERLGCDVRVGASGPVASAEIGRGLREARYALQVCRLEGWGSAGFGDLGTYRLLLSMSEPDALRAFADSVLAPLDAYDREQAGQLHASLRAFLQHNARWETAAAELFVHRHTLRYRMRKVEELTGRDLSSNVDRMEFWLALRARELLEAQVET